jgi:quinol monooxygenase YgiN
LPGVSYRVYVMSDEVFIHIASFADENAHQQFRNMEAFRAFTDAVRTRLKEAVIVNEVEEIGEYSNLL